MPRVRMSGVMLSKVLSAHEAGMLKRYGSSDGKMCLVQAAFDGALTPVEACHRDPRLTSEFDCAYEPTMSTDTLLSFIEREGRFR